MKKRTVIIFVTCFLVLAAVIAGILITNRSKTTNAQNEENSVEIAEEFEITVPEDQGSGGY